MKTLQIGGLIQDDSIEITLDEIDVRSFSSVDQVIDYITSKMHEEAKINAEACWDSEGYRAEIEEFFEETRE